jgi:hypothetical protein
MKVIAIIDIAAGKTPADLAPLRVAESQAAWELVKAGHIRALHYRETMTGAIAEMEAATTADARKLLEKLPAVAAGVLTITETIGLVPYVGFEALFAPTTGGTT